MKSRLCCVYVIILLTGLISCRVNRPAITPSTVSVSAQDYIRRYKDLAVSEMIRTGVPASITLAQGMVESDYGRSTLARTSNNHFGIKCHDDWKGPHVRYHDDRRNECFRKYSRPEDSFIDHSDFLRYRTRYSDLFSIPVTDYKGWARGLKKAGYATNPDYANMLIRKIEEHDLQYFDRLYASSPVKPGSQSVMPLDNEPVISVTNSEPAINSSDKAPETAPAPTINDNFTVQIQTRRIMENNRLQYIVVQDGETVEMIEKEYNVFRWELQRFNDLPDDFTLVPGQLLYLLPKRDRADKGKEKHTVQEGESLHSISQKYGVKLKKLYEYNDMAEGEEPAGGMIIRLRKVK